jgi:hypothetical protein
MESLPKPRPVRNGRRRVDPNRAVQGRARQAQRVRAILRGFTWRLEVGCVAGRIAADEASVARHLLNEAKLGVVDPGAAVRVAVTAATPPSERTASRAAEITGAVRDLLRAPIAGPRRARVPGRRGAPRARAARAARRAARVAAVASAGSGDAPPGPPGSPQRAPVEFGEREHIRSSGVTCASRAAAVVCSFPARHAGPHRAGWGAEWRDCDVVSSDRAGRGCTWRTR